VPLRFLPSVSQLRECEGRKTGYVTQRRSRSLRVFQKRNGRYHEDHIYVNCKILRVLIVFKPFGFSLSNEKPVYQECDDNDNGDADENPDRRFIPVQSFLKSPERGGLFGFVRNFFFHVLVIHDILSTEKKIFIHARISVVKIVAVTKIATMKRLFLDFDSTYRDRNLWPNPGEFGVLLSRSGRADAVNATDPVSTAAPILSWTSQKFRANADGPDPVIKGTIIGPGSGLGAANRTRVVVFQSSDGHLQQKENYYRHSVLRNADSPNEAARVLEYKYMGGNKGMVKLDSNIYLFSGTPIEMHDPTDFTDPLHAKLFVPCGADEDDYSSGHIIYNEDEVQARVITDYDKETGLVSMGDFYPPFAAPPTEWTWTPYHNYSIRKEWPLLVFNAGATSSLASVSNFMSGFDYVGSFIRVVPLSYSDITPPQGEIRRITGYNRNVERAAVFPPFSASPAGRKVEILKFSYDNVSPFTYKGTAEPEASPYAIRLLSLTLPNRKLACGSGGQIAFYPYVYVELTASNIPSNNLIMSNNPNAVNMMFKASIKHTYNLENAPFIRLTGDNMMQVIRFKAETNFVVKVILPNGDTFKPFEQEATSPFEPNKRIQVSMLFELYRC
jgi:hypothetical protein